MLFNTLTYAKFFGIVFVVSWLLRPHRRARLGFLLVASYVWFGVAWISRNMSGADAVPFVYFQF